MSLKVTDNTGKVKAYVTGLTKFKLGVGIPGEFAERKEDQGPINNAVLGYVHEFGVPGHIPPRPWLIPGFELALPSILKGMEAVIRREGGAGVERAFDMAGTKAVDVIKKRIVAGLNPALASSTLAARKRKKHERETPLIDTAQFLNSINHVIRPAGGE